MTIMRPQKTNVFFKEKSIKLKGTISCITEFSKDGKLLGIYDQTHKTLSVYDSEDITKCLNMIEKQKHKFQLKINFDDRSEPIDKIVFDLHDKFCALVSKTKIKVLNLYDREN